MSEDGTPDDGNTFVVEADPEIGYARPPHDRSLNARSQVRSGVVTRFQESRTNKSENVSALAMPGRVGAARPVGQQCRPR